MVLTRARSRHRHVFRCVEKDRVRPEGLAGLARAFHLPVRSLVASRERGLSVLELLIAIAIVALLAGFLAAFASQALAKANGGRDVANLRQIGVALLSYATEHSGRFPVAGGRIGLGETDPRTGQGPWTEQIFPYVSGNTNVFRSPTAPSSDPPGVFSPGYFLGTRAAMAADGRFSPVSILRMEAVSAHLLAGVVGAGGVFRPADWDKDDYTQSPAFDGNCRSRLTNPVAILFADGHVRQCTAFDTNSMTVEYEKGKWYGF